MQRNYLTKAFVVLFTVAALCSCNKDENEKSESDESGAIPDNTLTVVVENGSNYGDKIDLVKAEIPSGDDNSVALATASYENDRFTIALPESLGAQYLYDWAHDLREIPACVTVSNPNVKINSTMNLVAYKSDSRTGTIRYDVGGWKIFLVYVDGDVSITGSCTAEYTGDGGTYSIKYNYNAHLKTGWNIMYQKETVKTDNSREYELTTIVPVISIKAYFEDSKSKDCNILSFTVNGVLWNISGADIVHTYSSGTEETLLTPVITLSEGATINPASGTAQNFFTEQGVTYTVTAEDGETTKTYIVKATIEEDDENCDCSVTVNDNILTVVIENGDSDDRVIGIIKAENYYYDYDYSDGYYVTFATAPYNNSGFTITLPENVSYQYLNSWQWQFNLDSLSIKGITVSNPNVRTTGPMWLCEYQSNSRIGTFNHGYYYWNPQDHDWYVDSYLIYVDRDFIITGTLIDTETDDNNRIIYVTNKFNVHMKKGWNMIYEKEIEKTHEWELTTQVPAGSKCYF